MSGWLHGVLGHTIGKYSVQWRGGHFFIVVATFLGNLMHIMLVLPFTETHIETEHNVVCQQDKKNKHCA